MIIVKDDFLPSAIFDAFKVGLHDTTHRLVTNYFLAYPEKPEVTPEEIHQKYGLKWRVFFELARPLAAFLAGTKPLLFSFKQFSIDDKSTLPTHSDLPVPPNDPLSTSENTYTFILYVHDEWPVSDGWWEATEEGVLVEPKPNRLLAYPAKIVHRVGCTEGWPGKIRSVAVMTFYSR